jgi:hypothetical protein
MADELLTPLRTSCARCGHAGILNADDGARWWICAVCEGTGGIWTVSEGELADVRARILEAFPDAAAPAVRFFGTPVALALPSNSIVELVEPPSPRPAARERRRKYRPKLRSRDGLLFADVERAFAEAERLVGSGLKLRGRGHCRRVSLTPHYANYAVRGAPNSVIRVRVPQSWDPRRLMARVIVEKAAEILGVTPGLFIRREY